MTIMNKYHECWDQFCDALENAVFTDDGQCNCYHTTARTRCLLRNFRGIDVEATITHFEQLGGFCDCEIVYNVIWSEE